MCLVGHEDKLAVRINVCGAYGYDSVFFGE